MSQEVGIDEMMDVPITAQEMGTLITAAPNFLTKVKMSPREWLLSGYIKIDSS